jgi:predicted MFS family arabinose efflux permease
VLFVAAMFFFNYTGRAILGPLLVPMERALGLDHVQSTSLLLVLSTGFCAGVFFSGFAAAKIRPHRLVGGSAIAAGCMLLLLARADSAGAARLFILLMGLSCGFYLTAAMATLGSLVRAEDWSRTVAVHELSPAVSFIVSPLFAETAAKHLGWQGAILIMGYVSLGSGILFLLFGKGGREKTDMPSVSGVVSAFKRPVLWAFIWIFTLGIAGEFAPFSVLSLSLTVEQGLDSAAAARLLSLSRLATPFAVLAGGWAAMRFGPGRSLLLFLLAHGLALMAMALPFSLTGTTFQALAMMCQSAASGFVFPALFTVLARAFPQKQQPMVLSFCLPLAAYLAMGIGPVLLGACGEYLRFSYGYLIFGLLCLGTIPVLRYCEPEDR